MGYLIVVSESIRERLERWARRRGETLAECAAVMLERGIDLEEIFEADELGVTSAEVAAGETPWEECDQLLWEIDGQWEIAPGSAAGEHGS